MHYIEKIFPKYFIVLIVIIFITCIGSKVNAQIIRISGTKLQANNTSTFRNKRFNFEPVISAFKIELLPNVNTATYTPAANENPNSLLVDSYNKNAEPKKENSSLIDNLINRNYLSGDWWGIRNNLSESGLNFEFVYTGELFSNVYGGNNRGTTTLDNIDIIFYSDLEKSLGWGNTNLLVYFLGNNGGSPSDLVGTSQGVSNIEAFPTWKLYQILLKKYFFDKQFSIAVGLYDMNSEFDTRETSRIFINPSHGIGAEIAKSGLNGPSIFPTTSVALRFKYEFKNGNYFQTAVLDGAPGNLYNPHGTQIVFNKNDGLLLITEFGIDNRIDEKLNYKIGFGVWGYTHDFKRNNFIGYSKNIISLEKNYGFYLTAEKKFASYFKNRSKSLYGFIRIGYANKNINPVDFYFGTGIKIIGLYSGRYDDELGFALALSHNSLVYRNSTVILQNVSIKTFELNLELTYSMQLTPWLNIQPDIQYILNPSYTTHSKSAFVVGSRMQLNF